MKRALATILVGFTLLVVGSSKSQAAATPLGATCGDGKCSPPEDCNTCPQDCGKCCGNYKCEPPEDCRSCPEDCGPCK